MRQLTYLSSQLVLITIIISAIVGNSLIGLSDNQYQNLGPVLGSNRLLPQSSTNPSDPEKLTDDSALYEPYPSATNYYYNTSSQASSSYYHVFWVHPDNTEAEHDMFLYSDSGYSTLVNQSYTYFGRLSWVVVRPSSNQYYYPKVLTSKPTGSYGHVEWEDSSEVLSSTTKSALLGSAESLEVYQMTLNSGTAYSFILDVPSSCDFNLFLYYLSPGKSANHEGYMRCSDEMGIGIDESINGFIPTITGNYLILVTRWSGSGTYYLQTSEYLLAEEDPEYGDYRGSMSYHYRTGTASAGLYQIVWLLPTDGADDFNLYLYSDSAYSTLLASSIRTAGFLDWVVMNPNASQLFYVKVTAMGSSTGNAWLEWEESDVIARGAIYSESLSIVESIELYQTYLSAGKRYQFNLGVPVDGDYDLYIYHLSANTATNSLGRIAFSVTWGSGINESIIDFTPSTTDYYAIAVVRFSGSGSYALSFDYYTPPSIGGFSISAALLAVMAILAIIGLIYRKELLERIRFPERM